MDMKLQFRRFRLPITARRAGLFIFLVVSIAAMSTRVSHSIELHYGRWWTRSGMNIKLLYLILLPTVVVVIGATISFAITTDQSTRRYADLRSLQKTPSALSAMRMPETEQPKWYKDQAAAEQMAQKAAAEVTPNRQSTREFTYTVSTKGAVVTSRSSFAAQANKTLNDSRGWPRLGLSFREVASGGDFNLILSQASLLPSFSSSCSPDWSCRVGSSVIINDDRWQGATSAWYGVGGNLTDYRHYVVNHEVGHWLGHGHYDCSGSGTKAPVMLQQSISLQGCTSNPWPLESEIWTNR